MESFKKFRNIFQTLGNNCNFKILAKIKIFKKHSMCKFSINFLSCREIVQGRGEILLNVSPKVSSKLCEILTSKFHQSLLILSSQEVLNLILSSLRQTLFFDLRSKKY